MKENVTTLKAAGNELGDYLFERLPPDIQSNLLLSSLHDVALELKVEDALKAVFNETGVRPHAGLLETPKRWLRAVLEMTSGYSVDVGALFKTFDAVGYDELVVVGPVPFYSLCEHHLLPFHGSVWLGYLPNKKTGRIVGLSKLARLVDAHARRFQVQERMTRDIADDIKTHLRTEGVGVRIESIHTCMGARGIRKEGVMRTQSLLGCFRQPSVKAEFDNLVRRA